MHNITAHPASFRDKYATVIIYNNLVHRLLEEPYIMHYNVLMTSGLYESLTKKNWLVEHTEIALPEVINENIKTVLPTQIPFISYPYEWSFDMLKDAALLTLKIMQASIQKGMILKDASAFNIQWINGNAIFIDTSSFEKYDATKPWVAYTQFCQHFVAPLLAIAYSKKTSTQFLQLYSDGMELQDLTSILPKKTKLNLHIYAHIWLHAKTLQQQKGNKTSNISFSQKKLTDILQSLTILIEKLKEPSIKTTWDDYYEHTILNKQYLKAKEELVLEFNNSIQGKSLLDLGANDGNFTKLLLRNYEYAIAIDGDYNCINELYRFAKTNKKTIYPVVSGLEHPTPAIGWGNTERDSLLNRIQVDTCLALAVIHHLAISKNIPLQKICDLLATTCKTLIIEFVPKTDDKVKILLQNRVDIFIDYTIEDFIAIFTKKFTIVKQQKIGETDRELFLMRKKQGDE
jgi:hypothetical protein